MNNLSTYCGLVDAKIRASGKDLPVQSVPELQHHVKIWLSFFKESDKENLKIIGIYSTHAFGDEGLSLKMAHFNHSCKPNAG